MPDLPSGTVTFLFTDIEGSTALWERDRAAMAAAAEHHLALIREAVGSHGGVAYKTVGDGLQAAFPTAPSAVAAAIDAQRRLLAEPFAGVGPLRARMALHVGEATPLDGDYLTAPLNRLARLLASGHGGQILLSQAVQQLVRGALSDGAALRDLGEFRLRDLHDAERVFQVLHPDLHDRFPPLKSIDSRPNNLPSQATPFLGRESDVRGIIALLQRDDVRLVTLTGPGGVGKTRLALQAAGGLLDDFPDGVFFVPLAPLADPQLVPGAIADALGVRAEAGRSLIDALAAYLSGKRLLLVLDNFEHLLPAATVAAELLTTPGVEILATSRASLRLRGEWEFPVAPMSLPDPDRLPDLDRLSQYDAVRLFVQRAQAVNPDFRLSDDIARTVVEICLRLDGLPLAIELAAARTKLLPPAALLNRLERRLPILTGGARDLPARQQTLRDAIAWSHDLLGREEQTLFRRLAVFAGGSTLDAAGAVGNQTGELDLFRAMASLVDESLVQQRAEPSGDPRYVMLETIREYAWEQLDHSGEEATIRDAHAEWCLTLVERWPVHMRYLDEDEHAGLLAADQANLRAGLLWLHERRDWSRALRLAAGMGSYWFGRGHLQEGRGWLQRLLADSGAVARAVVADALVWAGLLAIFLGDLDSATTDLESALAAWREIDDSHGQCWSTLFLGVAAEFTGDEATADKRYHEALALARTIGDFGAAALALNNLGDSAYRRGDLAQAEAFASEATSVARQAGLTSFLVLALCTEAYVALAHGEVTRPARLIGEALTRANSITTPFFTADAMAGLAAVANAAGRPEQAARLLGAVAAICERTGLTGLGHDAQYRSTEALARRSLSDRAFTSAWEAGQAVLPEVAVVEARALANELVSIGEG